MLSTKAVKQALKNNPLTFKVFYPLLRAYRVNLMRLFQRVRGIRADKVVFSSFDSDAYSDNPRYISERLLMGVTCKDGQLVTKTGTRYKGLIIPGSGQMPEPRVIREVTNDSGAVVSAFSPSVLGQYCSPEQADGIRSRMKAAVASEEAGMLMDPVLNIYAAVGSANASDENGEAHRYHWCTAFNRQPDLPWAVTVLVEDPNVDPAEDPSGSTAAALIARDLFAWLKIHPHWEEAGKPD